MINKEKTMRNVEIVSEILDGMEREEVKRPQIAAFYRDLAQLRHYLLKDCKMEEERMGGISMRDGVEWGAYSDGSMRQPRNRMGQFVSGATDGGYSYGTMPREQIRQLAQTPDLPYEARELLRKAAEMVR